MSASAKVSGERGEVNNKNGYFIEDMLDEREYGQ